MRTTCWTKAINLNLGDDTVAYGKVTEVVLKGDRVVLSFDSNHTASFLQNHKLAVWS